MYPFGYGLSYTTFSYSEISVNNSQFRKGESIKLSIKVSNDGFYDGTETVQLYVLDHIASITRPIKELKQFKQLDIKAGESKIVEFIITEDDLSFWHRQGGVYAEAGEFVMMIGPNSENHQTKTITYCRFFEFI